jgi:hypothetical protein
MADTPAPSGPGLLDGWKAIADHLGKSVRTAQRWNQDFGLPVRRLGTGAREHVYAYGAELDAWRRSTSRANVRSAAAGEFDPDEPNGGIQPTENGAITAAAGGPPANSQSRRSRPRLVAAVGGLVVVAMAVAILSGLLPYPGRGPHGTTAPLVPQQPARYVVVNDRLRVFSDDGTFLWEHRFDQPLFEGAYAGHNGREYPPLASADTTVGAPLPSVHFADVDGDGHTEVLFVAYSRPSLLAARLHCFDGSGRVRWVFESEDRLAFGGEDYGVPTFIPWVLSHRGVDGTTSIWVTSEHQLWFPSVVYRLDHSGKVVARFVSNGRIRRMAFSGIDGREYVILGGVNNEKRSGSVAVFDLARFGGVTPAETAKYRCDGCPAVYPDHYFVFPATDVSRAFTGMPSVVHVGVTTSQDVAVSVGQGIVRLPGDPADANAMTNYRLDRAFRLRSADYYSAYHAVHDFLFRAGRMDHAFDEAREQSQLWPVLRWGGSRYARIMGPER